MVSKTLKRTPVVSLPCKRWYYTHALWFISGAHVFIRLEVVNDGDTTKPISLVSSCSTFSVWHTVVFLLILDLFEKPKGLPFVCSLLVSTSIQWCYIYSTRKHLSSLTINYVTTFTLFLGMIKQPFSQFHFWISCENFYVQCL